MAHTNPGTQFDPTWFEKIRLDLPGQVPHKVKFILVRKRKIY